MRRHPAVLEIIRRALVREEMHEELAAGFQQGGDFGQKEFVVLHVLEHLDAEDAVEFSCEGSGGEGVGADVAGYDGEVGEVLARGDAVDVLFLGGRVGEGGYGGGGEDLGEVEGEGTPAAAFGRRDRSVLERWRIGGKGQTHPISKIVMPSFSSAF